jgi:hypothetical protein
MECQQRVGALHRSGVVRLFCQRLQLLVFSRTQLKPS